MKILYLEDDITLSETVAEFLSDEGFDVVCVYEGNEALEAVYKSSFDMFLFDVNVPQIDGFALLKELRAANISTPAIFTTSLNSIDDLSKGYSCGADDYIKKPFVLKELLFRIKALLKREFKTQSELTKITKNIDFNTLANELIIDNQKILLNPKEVLLLKLLLKHKNECVSFESIYQNVWSFDETHSDMSLRTYIKNLRKYIGKENILSIKKVGYKFVQE
ncbi:MAG: two-component system response regulator [Sulfurimonas sp. RIFCSPHIGHO2_12_FULL_36_9]|uniref:response regulator transcription factor n=1 Tax=Sulfurimonas sp. RIFCSPLOWO2_12_36_12 TaxID=1802253 RepID=UPI0008CDE4A4|nr:response regulator transcription factor [Sulfurimonas sp. RIFCSPLOWO2_12_36_12]OHD98684.1 MAG: two-component system response regulator [Sulfurimonas sp. RIFCSPHIGHO2_12_FULL_36_9]OHD99730.1 MAG: two-component system response regulator [Sulfurimonas sp. RIFCSPLOWO2_02_FULL_36_28]OHE02901.1 MAG: two-component system response regulator [Sulfurimonas sp. RIFCSPLOWO2_12_36_12]OHE05581.1 MAG: two-component system response regulator [Sulfurimonas sp. RIFCSPLOWO2_12_FULL_36_74]